MHKRGSYGPRKNDNICDSFIQCMFYIQMMCALGLDYYGLHPMGDRMFIFFSLESET